MTSGGSGQTFSSNLNYFSDEGEQGKKSRGAGHFLAKKAKKWKKSLGRKMRRMSYTPYPGPYNFNMPRGDLVPDTLDYNLPSSQKKTREWFDSKYPEGYPDYDFRYEHSTGSLPYPPSSPLDAAWGWEAEKEKWERRVIERETAQLKKEPDYFKKRLHEMKTVCDNHAQANQVTLADIFNPPLSQVGTSQELGEAYYQWYEYKDKFDEEKRARKEEARRRQAEGSVPYETSGPSTSRGVGNVTEHMQSMQLRDGQ